MLLLLLIVVSGIMSSCQEETVEPTRMEDDWEAPCI